MQRTRWVLTVAHTCWLQRILASWRRSICISHPTRLLLATAHCHLNTPYIAIQYSTFHRNTCSRMLPFSTNFFHAKLSQIYFINIRSLHSYCKSEIFVSHRDILLMRQQPSEKLYGNFIYTQTHVLTYMDVCMYVYMYVCMYVTMYVCMYVGR